MRRIAEFLDGLVSGDLAKAVKIIGEFEIAFRRRLDIDRAEYENFIGDARLLDLRYRLSSPDSCNLILTQPDILLEIGIQF